MDRPLIGLFSGFLLLCQTGGDLAATGPTSPELSGVVIESAEEGFAAHRAGLRPGDVLLGWQRTASPPANPEPASGDLTSPFDLDEVEMEQAPRGDLTLAGTRDGEDLRVQLPPGEWRLRTRPQLAAPELGKYEEARSLIAREEVDKGLSLWRQIASVLGEAGDHADASWLFFRAARTADSNSDWESAEGAFEEARRQAKVLEEASPLAIITDSMARSLRDRSSFQRATVLYQEALDVRQTNSSRSLGIARSLNSLGNMAWYRGDLAAAEDYYRRVLAIREELAPQSLDVAQILGNLGLVITDRGDLAMAEDYVRRSLAIREKLVPQSLEVASSLDRLAALTIESDLAAAEDYYRRSLVLREKLAPQSLDVAKSLNGLGIVAARLGDAATPRTITDDL